MKPWIQNVSMADVRRGDHMNPGIRSALIQIVDPDMDHPVPEFDFGNHVYQFKFLDVEDESEFSIKHNDADKLVQILSECLEQERNVIVHCVAGVCRSGAVCEVGIMMGFRDTNAYRQPNMLVKHKMMKVLGWTYD